MDSPDFPFDSLFPALSSVSDNLKTEGVPSNEFKYEDMSNDGYLNDIENSFETKELMEIIGATISTQHDPSLPKPPPIGPPPRGDIDNAYKFEISLSSEKADRKKFIFSQKLNRVYLQMLAEMPVQFRWDYDLLQDIPLVIRATLILADSHQQESRVTRCHNHRVSNDVSNRDIPQNIVGHVLRSARIGADVLYCGSELDNQQWLSVAIPMRSQPPEGSHDFSNVYKFCCKHSCTSGINRRRVEVLFTLEDYNGAVLGRKSLGVRVCSCPKRDMEKDEEEFMKTTSDGPQPCKKRKMLPKKHNQLTDAHSSDVDPNTYSLPNLKIRGYDNFRTIINTICGLKAKDYLENPADPCANQLLLEIEELNNILKSTQPK